MSSKIQNFKWLDNGIYFLTRCSLFEAREAHRYLNNRLGNFRARGGGLLDHPSRMPQVTLHQPSLWRSIWGHLIHYWHQMSNCVLYILFPCCDIVCHMSWVSVLVTASIYRPGLKPQAQPDPWSKVQIPNGPGVWSLLRCKNLNVPKLQYGFVSTAKSQKVVTRGWVCLSVCLLMSCRLTDA